MKTKLRMTNDDPRGVCRNLFSHPFNPLVNFAVEDPLFLTTENEAQSLALSYAKYFGANSPLSPKAWEFVKKKQEVENTFSEKIHKQKSLIMPYESFATKSLSKAFLPAQRFLVPDSTLSPFAPMQTVYFSAGSVESLERVLKEYSLDHTPILYFPMICPLMGGIDFDLIRKLKEEHAFFLLVEDFHSFGLNGLTGFPKKGDTDLCDLIITHIPKHFGKMLTVLSGSYELLDTVFEFSIVDSALFPSAAYLGMFESMLSSLERVQNRRSSLFSLCDSLAYHLGERVYIHNPLITFELDSFEEKSAFAKALTEKDFLLPASAFKNHSLSLTLHLNSQMKEGSIRSLLEVKSSYAKQVILESI